MKSFSFWLLMISVVASCSNNYDTTSNSKESKILPWTNKYEVFDEPKGQSIAGMKFYLLMVSTEVFDTMVILSIRGDSNSIQGFYKKIPYDQIPALFENKIETKTFKYSTVRFSPNYTQVDSIKGIMKRNDLFSLKDSIAINANDGLTKEIIFYDGERFYDLYRGYALDKHIEPGFINSFNEIMKVIRPEPTSF